MSGNANRSRPAVNHFDIALTVLFQANMECFRVGLLRHRDHAGTPTLRLLKSSLEIVARSEGRNLKALGIRLSHTQSAAPDGARRSQNGNAFHVRSDIQLLLLRERRRVTFNPISLSTAAHTPLSIDAKCGAIRSLQYSSNPARFQAAGRASQQGSQQGFRR